MQIIASLSSSKNFHFEIVVVFFFHMKHKRHLYYFQIWTSTSQIFGEVNEVIFQYDSKHNVIGAESFSYISIEEIEQLLMEKNIVAKSSSEKEHFDTFVFCI